MIRLVISLVSILAMAGDQHQSSMWALTKIGLTYNNKVVQFSEKSLQACNACRLHKIRQYSPAGPININHIYQSAQLIAAYIEGANKEIMIPNSLGRTVFKVTVDNNAWQLETGADIYTLRKKQVTKINVNSNQYLILPLNLTDNKLDYIWLKL